MFAHVLGSGEKDTEEFCMYFALLSSSPCPFEEVGRMALGIEARALFFFGGWVTGSC